MRILGVDPGEKRIGLAVSDPGQMLAKPLEVLLRQSYTVDAGRILEIAHEQDAELIIIGQSLDDEGKPTPAGRMSARLAEAIQSEKHLQVILWDEAMSTHDAVQARREMGVKRNQRKGHLDAAAAAVILQSYLDAHPKAG
jgi:putative Holliday junction resolvase